MNNESFVNEIKGLGQLTRQLFRLLFGKGFTLAHAIFENVAIDRPKKHNIFFGVCKLCFWSAFTFYSLYLALAVLLFYCWVSLLFQIDRFPG